MLLKGQSTYWIYTKYYYIKTAGNDSTVLDIQYVLMLPSKVSLKMEKLTFIIQSGFRIDANKMKPIDMCLIA